MSEAASIPPESLGLPRPGERIDRYRVVREIGRGAMGVVFEVVHEKLDRTCALKVLRPLATQDEGAVRRFEREAKILAKLSSPHLVEVLDVDRTEAGAPYLVMELLDGETLEERLAKGPLPIADALAIVLDICAGAEAAHAEGVVHRDLKPSNVILTKSGAKIVDFGVAAFTSGSMDGSTASVAGTPRTMSPEQLLGERVGPASDVFAIGVVAYRAIAGRYPFEAESMAAQMLAIMKGHAPLADVADVSRALSNVIANALARDPGERIGSAKALAEALRRAHEGLDAPEIAESHVVEAPPPDMPSTKQIADVAATPPAASGPVLSANVKAGASVILVAIAVGATFLFRTSPPNAEKPAPSAETSELPSSGPSVLPSTAPLLVAPPPSVSASASLPSPSVHTSALPPRASARPSASRADTPLPLPSAKAAPNGSGFPPHL